jgi:hypothetical protein
MFSANVKRIVVALLVVTALTLALPGKAHAVTLGLNSTTLPGAGLWTKALNFLHSVFAGTPTPPPNHLSKFGPAHTSDGLTRAVAVEAY